MKINKSIALGILLFFIGITATFGYEYRKLNEQVQALIIENKQMEETLDAEILKDYVEDLPEDLREYSIDYDSWTLAKEISEYFYEDSDGRFKEEWGHFLTLAAESKEIDPFIVYELLRVETGGTFDPKTVGPETMYGHAYGLAQFMKNTAPWIAEMAGIDYEEDKLFDPYYSIQLAVTYLDFLYHQYGDWNYALTAYHRGIYGLEQYIYENGHARSWYAVEIQESAKDNELLVYDE
ncbi:soluble lytic murein transglycosylase-like protein [Evansella vedderi]|uniref:Soluble lytic murein transglycosylase-like protein n=1 Tax=Evansella vedderi TaxID=38282 RepID=A0ABU0A3K6_9BACI|nr:transglycosylase SLT domain-containing protein [Evansella vedderi]MDQ0258064.1 soluble lytic murein transglycosylase-like protein [Evansella vedderi]